MVQTTIQQNKSGSKNIIVSNVARLDPQHPIPFEQKGLTFMAERQYKYIPFLGTQDNFFETLAETRMLSPTNMACVNTKVKYAVGSGWTFGDETKDKLFKDEFARSVNKKGESLNDIIKKIFDNLFTSGNVFINIVRVKVGNTKKIRVYVKNNFDSRLAWCDDPDVVEDVIFSSQFRKDTGYMTLTSDQIEVPIWTGSNRDLKWKKDAKGNEHICIHIKNDIASCDHYGLPSNVASLLQQQLEYKGARFNLDNFLNNMFLGGVLMLQSDMSEAEALKHGKKIVSTHTGDGKTGRVMVMASPDGFENSKWIPFDQSRDGSFIELDGRCEEKIIIANEWDATLAGINTGSALGRGAGYFKEIFEVKYKTVIRPEQEKIVGLFLNELLFILDNHTGSKFLDEKMPIDIRTPMPISYGTLIDPNKVMTIAEGRRYFPDLKNEDIDAEIAKQIINSPSKTGNENVSNKPA